MATQQHNNSEAGKSGQTTMRNVIRKITLTKLEGLKTEKELMTQHYGPVLEKVKMSMNDLEKLSLLHSALKESPVSHCDDDEKLQTTLSNLDVLLKTLKDDPSVSLEYLQHLIQELTSTIVLALKKCEYSFLYGNVLSEWLESEDRKNRKGMSSEEAGIEFEIVELDAMDVDGEESDKTKSIREMKERFFTKTSSGFEKEKFTQFLTETFSFENNIEHLKIWNEIKDATYKFGNTLLESTTISTEEVIACIKGLLGENLFIAEKRQALMDLQENSVAVSELSTLLTSQLKNLKRWNWSEPVSLDVRREISGRFRAFMDEDLITAIFLQYIGAVWAAHLRAEFHTLYYSAVKLHNWESSRQRTIGCLRKRTHKSIFLANLPSSVHNQRQNLPYSDEEHDNINPRNSVKNVIQAKHHLLHFLCNEIKLNSILRPEINFLAVQTDFEWFGPSLDHEAILTLMEFFNMPGTWLDFFKKFLQAPLKFPEENEANTRTRGVPISHCLSMVFGESLMFVMDFVVNRSAGIDLYRMHDDILFWHHDEEKMTKAWETMQSYANIVGLKFNEEKGASVKILTRNELTEMMQNAKMQSEILAARAKFPQQNICWGFLKLYSDGVFRIDLEKFIPKMKEMEKLLLGSSCVMDWVNVYNKYMGFFVRNCASNALVFGEQHIDQIISAIAHIHNTVFAATNGNVKTALVKQFGIFKNLEIMDAWIYWPTNQGGLGLKNPILDLLAVKESPDYRDSSTKKALVHNFDDLPETDKLLWEKAIEKLKEVKEKKKRKYVDDDCDDCEVQPKREKTAEEDFTFEDYCGNREARCKMWFARFEKLLQKPKSGFLRKDKLEELQFKAIFPDGEETVYDHWLFSYYAKQLCSHFGNLEFINTKLIPMSMVSEMTRSRLSF